MAKKINEVYLEMVTNLENKVAAEQFEQSDLSLALAEAETEVSRLQTLIDESALELNKAVNMLADIKKIK